MKTFLQENRVVLWIVAAFIAGVFWFYVLMNPWMGFYDSDAAVPFQLILEPWRPQDLYYWGTTRRGMLFELLWKFMLTLVGGGRRYANEPFLPELFFLSHVIVYFFGLIFWLRSLQTNLGRVIFLLFFLPLTHRAVEHQLSPEQPYSFLFFLNGLFLWVLLKTSGSRRKTFFLACLLGMTYIQHELSALLFLMVCLAHFRSVAGPQRGQYGTFFFWICVWIALAQAGRVFSREWEQQGGHYGFTSFPAFLKSLSESLSQGRWSHSIHRLPGHALTLGVLYYALELVRSRRVHRFFQDPEQMLVLGSAAVFVAVHASHWFEANRRDPRYFTFLIPSLIFGLLLRFERFSGTNLKQLTVRPAFYLSVCLLPLMGQQDVRAWLNPVLRARLNPPPEEVSFLNTRIRTCHRDAMDRMLPESWRNADLSEWWPGWENEACYRIVESHIRSLSAAISASGCSGYIDEYWSSYVLAIRPLGTVRISTGNDIRNPALLEETRKARPLCVMPRNGYAFRMYMAGLDCKSTDHGFLLCESLK